MLKCGGCTSYVKSQNPRWRKWQWVPITPLCSHAHCHSLTDSEGTLFSFKDIVEFSFFQYFMSTYSSRGLHYQRGRRRDGRGGSCPLLLKACPQTPLLNSPPIFSTYSYPSDYYTQVLLYTTQLLTLQFVAAAGLALNADCSIVCDGGPHHTNDCDSYWYCSLHCKKCHRQRKPCHYDCKSVEVVGRAQLNSSYWYTCNSRSRLLEKHACYRYSIVDNT